MGYQCSKCGSRSGFRGEQETKERRRADGLMERYAVGPEIVRCKSCGTIVEKEEATPDKVLKDIPSHIKALGDEMLSAPGAPTDLTPQERESLYRELMESEDK